MMLFLFKEVFMSKIIIFPTDRISPKSSGLYFNNLLKMPKIRKNVKKHVKLSFVLNQIEIANSEMAVNLNLTNPNYDFYLEVVDSLRNEIKYAKKVNTNLLSKDEFARFSNSIELFNNLISKHIFLKKRSRFVLLSKNNDVA